MKFKAGDRIIKIRSNDNPPHPDELPVGSCATVIDLPIEIPRDFLEEGVDTACIADGNEKPFLLILSARWKRLDDNKPADEEFTVMVREMLGRIDHARPKALVTRHFERWMEEAFNYQPIKHSYTSATGIDENYGTHKGTRGTS